MYDDKKNLVKKKRQGDLIFSFSFFFSKSILDLVNR
jgi:hypothetical protein